VKAIPEGYAVLTPACALVGCADAIAAYQRIFGAEVRMRFDRPDGKVAHCELRFGDSTVMLGEAGGVERSNWQLMIYVPACDAVFARTQAAGWEVKAPPTDQFYGDRNARVVDPWGNTWYISTHVEDVSDEEVRRRMAKLTAG
jgi:PhnB protein